MRGNFGTQRTTTELSEAKRVENREMVGCVGNAPTLVRLDIRFTGGTRSLVG